MTTEEPTPSSYAVLDEARKLWAQIRSRLTPKERAGRPDGKQVAYGEYVVAAALDFLVEEAVVRRHSIEAVRQTLLTLADNVDDGENVGIGFSDAFATAIKDFPVGARMFADQGAKAVGGEPVDTLVPRLLAYLFAEVQKLRGSPPSSAPALADVEVVGRFGEGVVPRFVVTSAAEAKALFSACFHDYPAAIFAVSPPYCSVVRTPKEAEEFFARYTKELEAQSSTRRASKRMADREWLLDVEDSLADPGKASLRFATLQEEFPKAAKLLRELWAASVLDDELSEMVAAALTSGDGASYAGPDFPELRELHAAWARREGRRIP